MTTTFANNTRPPFVKATIEQVLAAEGLRLYGKLSLGETKYFNDGTSVDLKFSVQCPPYEKDAVAHPWGTIICPMKNPTEEEVALYESYNGQYGVVIVHGLYTHHYTTQSGEERSILKAHYLDLAFFTNTEAAKRALVPGNHTNEPATASEDDDL